jgi:hypothetical protein
MALFRTSPSGDRSFLSDHCELFKAYRDIGVWSRQLYLHHAHNQAQFPEYHSFDILSSMIYTNLGTALTNRTTAAARFPFDYSVPLFSIVCVP